MPLLIEDAAKRWCAPRLSIRAAGRSCEELQSSPLFAWLGSLLADQLTDFTAHPRSKPTLLAFGSYSLSPHHCRSRRLDLVNSGTNQCVWCQCRLLGTLSSTLGLMVFHLEGLHISSVQGLYLWAQCVPTSWIQPRTSTGDTKAALMLVGWPPPQPKQLFNSWVYATGVAFGPPSFYNIVQHTPNTTTTPSQANALYADFRLFLRTPMLRIRGVTTHLLTLDFLRVLNPPLA